MEEFVYLWCDGVNFKVLLGDDKRASLLVVIGVNSKGEKKLLAAEGGYRESKESWKALFLALESRGPKSPLMILRDGALGLWSCVRELELFEQTKEQRCWGHKMANVRTGHVDPNVLRSVSEGSTPFNQDSPQSKRDLLMSFILCFSSVSLGIHQSLNELDLIRFTKNENLHLVLSWRFHF